MSCIVYLTNKKTNTKYAYRSESYRDPVTKQPKSRRTYLGRVDPVTNEIIPKAEKGRRNRNPVGINLPVTDTQHNVPSQQINIVELKNQVKALQQQQDELKTRVSNMAISISNILSLISEVDI